MGLNQKKTVMRLDKYLADMGIGTRSQVKEKIRRALVSVNGKIVSDPQFKVDTSVDSVACDGTVVGYIHYEYYMLNKPAGVISATEDKKTRTVVDLIDSRARRDLFPVGRLDRDTEGLLLITNDGALAHNLLSPRKHVSKVYFARVAGLVDSSDVAAFKAGLVVAPSLTALPARLEILKTFTDGKGDVYSEITLEIHEGKFHQVKRMFETVGKRVVYLKRLSMGSLMLDEQLAPGQYRPLSEKELAALKGENGGSHSGLMEDIEAVIFDLDGTMVDSMWMWADIDKQYLAGFGIKVPEGLEEAIAGISVTQTAVYFQKTFKIKDSVEKIIQDWNDMAYEKYSHETPLKPGIIRFLTSLKTRGIRCAIATSNTRRLTDAVLNAHDLRGYFDVILTGEDIHKGKPDPDVYLEAARLLNVSTQKCLVFEDIPLGIMAAKRAGMRCCAVEDAYSAPEREIKRQLADDYIESYEEIRGITND